MNMNPKHSPLPGLAFLSCQDYDLIDFQILQYEKRKEELERKGHVFCSMCDIEIVHKEICEKCNKAQD